MASEYALAPRLKIVMDHLRAVRALDDYQSCGGMDKDMRDMANHLMQVLNRDVIRPAGWGDLAFRKYWLYSGPASNKWRVFKDESIALKVYVAWPAFDDVENDMSVNLHVPPKWEKRKRFNERIKAPAGFEKFTQYPEGEMDDSCSIWKFVRYMDFVGADNIFDAPSFIAEITDAVKTLVGWEKNIDTCLADLK